MINIYLHINKIFIEMKSLAIIGLTLNKIGGFYKIFLIAITTSATFPILDALKKYLTPNVDYWAIALIMIAIDTGCGFYAHSGWWSKEAKNNLDASEFITKVLRKVFACASWIILIGVLENHSKNIAMFTDIFSVTTIISWLGWSIAGSIYIFTGGKFPPKKIMEFFNNDNTKKEEDEVIR